MLLSVGLVGTWIYHLYDKTVYSNRIREVYVKDSAAVADAIRDSLHKFYSVSIRNLDAELDSTRNSADSLQNNLDKRMNEIYTLRLEINNILKNRNASQSDLLVARRKINELQSLIQELKEQNHSMEEEKKRLSSILEQLSGEVKSLEQNMRRLDQENKELAEKVFLASSFLVSELNFYAVMIKGNREQKTTQAKKADKFVVSFSLQNNIADYENAELVIILTDPAGQTVQHAMWDSGNFSTRNEGIKSFTRKMRFEYQKGDVKKFSFSLDANRYEKGTYSLQLYHNGIRIANAFCPLN